MNVEFVKLNTISRNNDFASAFLIVKVSYSLHLEKTFPRRCHVTMLDVWKGKSFKFLATFQLKRNVLCIIVDKLFQMYCTTPKCFSIQNIQL